MGVSFAPDSPWEWQDSRVGLRNGGLFDGVNLQGPPAFPKSYRQTQNRRNTNRLEKLPRALHRRLTFGSGAAARSLPPRQDSM